MTETKIALAPEQTAAVTPPAAPPQPAPAPRASSNATLVVKLLTRARGATVAEMQDATGWKPHSARAFLSGLRKSGRTLVKEQRKSGETSYRIAAARLSPSSETSQ
jgi:hypothetical protein